MNARNALIALLLVGCSSTRPPVTPQRVVPSVSTRTMADEPFRAKPPLADGSIAWTPPPIVESRLPNGVRVLVVERRDVPVVSVRIVSDRGADQADRGIPEVWAESILRAGVDHPWWDLRDDYDRMAVDWKAHADPDATEIEFNVLAKLFDPATRLIGDLVSKPVVTDAELERAKDRVFHQIKSADIKLHARRSLGRMFYPVKHPYNEPFAPSENVPRVSSELVLAYHASAFTPQHTTVVVVGDVSADAAQKTVAAAFGGLGGPKMGAVPPPAAPKPGGPRIVLIDRPLASQAYVAAAWLAPALPTDDEIPLSVARQILTERLFDDVRRGRAATYGLRMTIPFRRSPHVSRVEGLVQIDSVTDALKEILADLDELSSEPPTDDVMSWARLGVTSDWIARFEGPSSTASAVSMLAVRGASTTFFSERLAKIRETKGEDVLRAAKMWLATDAVRFLVIGDASKLKGPLVALGLGDVMVRGPYLP